MNHRWMITAAAAALVAGSGFAYAQGNMGHEGGAAGGAGIHQGASSPSTGAAGHEGSTGMKSSQAEHEQKGASTNRNAQRETKGAEKRTVGQSATGERSAGEKSSQENKSDRSKGMSSQNEEKGATGKKTEERNGRTGNMKAEGREHDGNMKAEGQERNGNMKAEGRNGNVNAQGANGNATAQGSRGVTTGQAGAGAKLSPEQRTRITSIIHGQHVATVNNVNFPVSVGTRVPGGIGFHPLPAEIATIYPEWRGYEYFLVRDEIVVVDPRTLEIVDVLPA